MIGVGIAGAGFMGMTHAKAYATLENAEVVAVADISSNKASEIANLTKVAGFKTYSSVEGMINDPSVDVVDICLPTFLHAEYTVMAAEAGKNVLCEKPIALSLDQADEMIEAIKETDMKFMVAHVLRFLHEYQALKDIYDKRRIGSITSLACRRLSPTPRWSWQDWVLRPKTSGSAALDLHIHDVDYIIHLLGKPSSVYSQGTSDHIYTIYEYPSGKPSVFAEGGWDLPEEFPFRMSYAAVFEKGFVEFRSDREPSLTIYPAEKQKHLPKKLEPSVRMKDKVGDISKIVGYYNEIKYFIDCVDKGIQPTVITPEDARTALEVNLKEIESAKSGKKISI
jgi:predicted dehydrogenase